MKQRNHDPCRWHEEAAQWVLGDREFPGAEDFEGHLDDCETCSGELASLDPLLGSLALAAPEAEPSADLFDRLRARIREEAPPEAPALPWMVWGSDATDDVSFRSESDGEWEATPIPGIEVRRLYVDASVRRYAMMVRMQPGTSFPAHDHDGPEECVVLEGDLSIGERTMHAGDFMYAPTGSHHEVHSTEGGCVIILSSTTRAA